MDSNHTFTAFVSDWLPYPAALRLNFARSCVDLLDHHKLVDRVGFEPTTFRVRAEYSNPVELPIHKLTWAGYLVVMRPLRIFYTRKKRISSLNPYGTDWIFHTPLKIGGSGGYCPHTNILIKSQMPVYCSFTSIIKNFFLHCQRTIIILPHFITSSTSFLKNGPSCWFRPNLYSSSANRFH